MQYLRYLNPKTERFFWLNGNKKVGQILWKIFDLLLFSFHNRNICTTIDLMENVVQNDERRIATRIWHILTFEKSLEKLCIDCHLKLLVWRPG